MSNTDSSEDLGRIKETDGYRFLPSRFGVVTFPPRVLDFWRPPQDAELVVVATDSMTICADPALPEPRPVSVLTTDDGRTTVSVTPSVADRLGLWESRPQSPDGVREILTAAGLVLHGADHLFYFAEPARQVVLSPADREPDSAVIRTLTLDDSAAFAAFQASAPGQDLEDSFVELDHWAVSGAFVGGRLVSAASAYPWGGAQLADIGVLTLPEFRGRGLARRVVRAISRDALLADHEPQYRCQFDNHASVALAGAAGLSRFGSWEVVAADSAG